MSGLTTHVLDTAKGCPAVGMRVVLKQGGAVLAEAKLDGNGRASLLEVLSSGAYELLFYAGDYQGAGFFDVIPVMFHVRDERHYHVPLILSPFSYSTYRGG